MTSSPRMSISHLWKTYFLPYFRLHKKTYITYILLLLASQLFGTLIIPSITASYVRSEATSTDPKISQKWFNVNFISRFSALVVVGIVLSPILYFKSRLDAILPTLHNEWLRQQIFASVMTSFQQKRDALPVGVFLMRYNVLPREVRYVYENMLAVVPSCVGCFYLWLYFTWFDIRLGTIYFACICCLLLFVRFSKSLQVCLQAVRRRAEETLTANDIVSQEILNLDHIYANQQEENRIQEQAKVESSLTSSWQSAQIKTNLFLREIDTGNGVIFLIMLVLFYHYFRHHPERRSTHWATIFVMLSVGFTGLQVVTSRLVGILHGVAMIQVFYDAIPDITMVSPGSSPLSYDLFHSDWAIEIRHLSKKIGEKILFDNFNTLLPTRSKVLLQGSSGSGKSTLFSMLTRFTSPDHGSITINNIAIDRIDLSLLRSTILYMPQHSHLYNESVYYNIFWTPPSDIQKKHVQSILSKYDFDKILPVSLLNQSCGPMGKNMSHGMQKVIMLLRAYYRRTEHTRILLFDEPFSSLDPSTQTRVFHFLKDISHNCTLIISNHIVLSPSFKSFFTHTISSSSFVKNHHNHSV